MSAQVNSRELVTVEGKAVERLMFRDVPVVTLKQVDEVHGSAPDTARRNFNRNRKHFSEGVDFFGTNCPEAKALGFTAPSGLILLTESGYLMIAKSFTDDLAWKVQRQLVENYFRRKPQTAPVASNQIQLLEAMLEAVKAQQAEQSALRQELQEVKRQVAELKAAPPAQLPAPVPAKQATAKHQKPFEKRATSDTRSLDNPLYARFKKLYKNRTLSWWHRKHKIGLSFETLGRVFYRGYKVSPLTLTIICSHLGMTRLELEDAAAYLGIEDKLGVFSCYLDKE